MTPPNASLTARERARAELTREIKEEAKRQLAAAGADGLSLRAVARALGMVSSAVYRYFPSRDDLLTVLIIDAYNGLGEAVEEAIGSARAAGDGPRGQWIAACRSARDWAREHPHEYALIYGSPVPGYRAPEATIEPASRLPLAFTGILRDAAARGETAQARGEARAPAAGGGVPVEGILAEQAARVVAELSRAAGGAPAVPPEALVRGVMAWTQLFGMLSFELFGQFVGTFDPPDALFEHAAAQMAAFVGL